MNHLSMMILLLLTFCAPQISTAFVPMSLAPSLPLRNDFHLQKIKDTSGNRLKSLDSTFGSPINNLASSNIASRQQDVSVFSQPPGRDNDTDEIDNLAITEDQQMKKKSLPTKRKEGEVIDPILILPVATLVSISLLLCFVLYTKLTNPVTDFDIDFYMALDDVQKSTTTGGNGGGMMMSGGDYVGGGADTIVGLPKLSPAEQLVGALFGPPQSSPGR